MIHGINCVPEKLKQNISSYLCEKRSDENKEDVVYKQEAQQNDTDLCDNGGVKKKNKKFKHQTKNIGHTNITDKCAGVLWM